MRTFSAAVALLLVSLLGTPVSAEAEGETDSGAPTVYVIPVTGDVEPAMAVFIGRAVRHHR